MAAKGDDRVKSATLLTTQVDFTHAGDLKVFAADEEQIAMVERQMAEHGYLAGSKMAAAFNLMRSNDLIWPYVINNYLKGKPPMPFDMLYWNADATRMPAANHSFYLRACYLENRLTKGTMTHRQPEARSEEGHSCRSTISPRARITSRRRARSISARRFSAVRCASCWRARATWPAWSIIPAKKKYQYWTGGAPSGDNLDRWIAGATEHPGSWWPDWLAWLKAHDAAEDRCAHARRRQPHSRSKMRREVM